MNSLSLENLAKEDLEKYQDALKDIKLYEERIDLIMTKLSISSSWNDEIKVQTSPRPGSRDELFDELFRKQKELRTHQIAAIQKMNDIEDKINKIGEPVYKRILKRKYISNQTLDRICEEEHYTKRWIIELHNRALLEYGRILANTSP